MTVTHVGSNTQYASNWESIFTKGTKKKSAAPVKHAKASAKKKSGKKKAGKK